MEILFVLFVPLISLMITGLLTSANRSFVVPRWVSRQVPAHDHGAGVAAEASGAYRSPGLVTRLERLDETHSIETLPRATREAAALLRFAVCVASIFVLPILVVIVVEPEPSAIFYLGGSGLLLAAGQFLARRSLMTARPSSPAVALGVGIWTVLHNVGVVACVYVCGLPGTQVDSEWGVLRAGNGGALFLLYALGSMGLGYAILRAVGPQRRWLEENSALAPAVVA